MSKHNKEDYIKVGITIGDLNGIGLEIIMKTFEDNRILDNIVPIIYGSSKAVSFHRKALNIDQFNYLTIKKNEEAKPRKVNLINCWNEEVQIDYGVPSSESGKYAFKSLELATQDMVSSKLDVLLTAPIHKESIQNAGFNFPGHTEYLAKLSNVDEALMMMIADDLRVALVTSHIPLSEVPKEVNKEKINKKIEQLLHTLKKDFGIVKPRIAVLGLNPHAGEMGKMGDEDREIIAPVVQEWSKKGELIYGPFPADGLFGSENRRNFDAILAMYHDQGLAPFKALAFQDGVNFTAGLPIVRTSPDHGTAFEIAGKGIADPSSFRSALYTAIDIFKTRKEEKELHANPLKKQEVEENE